MYMMLSEWNNVRYVLLWTYTNYPQLGGVCKRQRTLYRVSSELLATLYGTLLSELMGQIYLGFVMYKDRRVTRPGSHTLYCMRA